MALRIMLPNLSWNLAKFKSSNDANRKDVERRREQDRKDERNACPDRTHDQCYDGEDDGEESGSNGRQLRALSKWHTDEERPTGQRQSE